MIKIFDLKEQYKKFGKVIDKKIINILSSGNYILGENVALFEDKVKKYLNTKYTLSCNSGTDALVLSLRSLGIQSGDEVITTPFTWISKGEMIALLKAKRIFVDIEPDTYNIDANLIEAAITKKQKR